MTIGQGQHSVLTKGIKKRSNGEKAKNGPLEEAPQLKGRNALTSGYQEINTNSVIRTQQQELTSTGQERALQSKSNGHLMTEGKKHLESGVSLLLSGHLLLDEQTRKKDKNCTKNGKDKNNTWRQHCSLMRQTSICVQAKEKNLKHKNLRLNQTGNLRVYICESLVGGRQTLNLHTIQEHTYTDCI